MGSNLPPGLTEGDLPGNRPEDVAWEGLHETIDDDCAEHGLCDQDAHAAWKIGLESYRAARQLGARFNHDGD